MVKILSPQPFSVYQQDDTKHAQIPIVIKLSFLEKSKPVSAFINNASVDNVNENVGKSSIILENSQNKKILEGFTSLKKGNHNISLKLIIGKKEKILKIKQKMKNIFLIALAIITLASCEQSQKTGFIDKK